MSKCISRILFVYLFLLLVTNVPTATCRENVLLNDSPEALATYRIAELIQLISRPDVAGDYGRTGRFGNILEEVNRSRPTKHCTIIATRVRMKIITNLGRHNGSIPPYNLTQVCPFRVTSTYDNSLRVEFASPGSPATHRVVLTDIEGEQRDNYLYITIRLKDLSRTIFVYDDVPIRLY